jgi:hypothetical protein
MRLRSGWPGGQDGGGLPVTPADFGTVSPLTSLAPGP